MRHVFFVLTLSAAILILGVAALPSFGTESWTFYSPHFTKAVWILKLPGGSQRSIDATHGLIALISSPALAILLLTLAATQWAAGTGAALRPRE